MAVLFSLRNRHGSSFASSMVLRTRKETESARGERRSAQLGEFDGMWASAKPSALVRSGILA
ncbi:hypothetical protein C1855_07680 [Eggerthella lenta]|nr:hypothetical protein C1855_07680 [Eggerthella lenta]